MTWSQVGPREILLDDTNALERVRQLLDTLAGPESGRDLSRRLLESDESAAELSRALAATATFERLYKEARTATVQQSELKGPDAAFVDIPDLEIDLPFEQQFERFFKPRLGVRAEGFATLFRYLAQRSAQPLILETGSMRIPGNSTSTVAISSPPPQLSVVRGRAVTGGCAFADAVGALQL